MDHGEKPVEEPERSSVESEKWTFRRKDCRTRLCLPPAQRDTPLLRSVLQTSQLRFDSIARAQGQRSGLITE